MPEINITGANNYDTVPYESYPYANAQAERLYTIGKLFGMQPVDFKACKLLELGCASGGNIIAMATMYPDSTFIGIDYSAVQIKRGQEDIAKLGLKNITLQTMSIADINAKFGQFDYIVAHGVLSWVPKDMQEKVFDICSKNLTKNGIAYISYNTLPGWNAVRSIREMMLYHTKDIVSPEDKVREARLLLKFITEANADNKTPYAQGIDAEIATLNESEDSYLFHDHLEENNEPFYFHQVVEKAVNNGLQYLGDTAIASMFLGNLPNQAAETLAQAVNDVVKVEQYMDFIRNRRFRSSLFCNKDIVLNRNLKPECLEDFYIIAQISSDTDLNNVDLTGRTEIVINFNSGTNLKTINPIVIQAIKILAKQQGKPIATKALLNEVFDVIGVTANKDLIKNTVLQQLLRLVLADAIGIFSHPGNFVTTVSQKPKASELARYQATTNSWITNQRSEKGLIDIFNRVLIQYLDGKNDFDTILEKMVKHVENDDLIINVDGVKVSDKEQIHNVVKDMTKQNIQNLAPLAVLVA